MMLGHHYFLVPLEVEMMFGRVRRSTLMTTPGDDDNGTERSIVWWHSKLLSGGRLSWLISLEIDELKNLWSSFYNLGDAEGRANSCILQYDVCVR